MARAVEVANLLEDVARMAYDTVTLNAAADPIPAPLLDKHFLRKHGPDAYYGARKSDNGRAQRLRVEGATGEFHGLCGR